MRAPLERLAVYAGIGLVGGLIGIDWWQTAIVVMATLLGEGFLMRDEP
jgi:hypothetical protein